MDRRRELGDFLRRRRAGVEPASAGLPAGAGRRRTPGLRREELAALAGISVDWYIRLEQGRAERPSPSVARLAEADARFATWWAEHDVSEKTAGVKRFRNDVDEIREMRFDSVLSPAADEQRLIVYTPLTE